MLLLKLISPKKLPRRKSEWRFHHKCYKVLLNHLLKRYSPGVIDDTITLNGVEVKLTLRDEWFENELTKFGISFSPTIKATQKLSKKRYRRSSLFSWKETLTVAQSRNRCSIVRNESVTLDSNFDSTLQSSGSNDAILVIKLSDHSRPLPKKHKIEDISETIPATEEQPTEPTNSPNPAPTKKHKIHIKDTVTPKEAPTPQSPVPDSSPEQPSDSFTQHQGFEENDIF